MVKSQVLIFQKFRRLQTPFNVKTEFGKIAEKVALELFLKQLIDSEFRSLLLINTNKKTSDFSEVLYPEPESNRHGCPQVFETSASTNSAIRAISSLINPNCFFIIRLQM